jgi:hypothetical protein
MYSPKIKPDLIPMLYRIKQSQGGKPMTKIVDEMLRPAVLTLHESLSCKRGSATALSPSNSESTGQRGYSNPLRRFNDFSE